MKRTAVIMLVTLIALGGCASTIFLGILATTDYVNTRTKELEEDKAAQIKKLQAQMDEIMALKQQMQS